jgi:dipeptidase
MSEKIESNISPEEQEKSALSGMEREAWRGWRVKDLQEWLANQPPDAFVFVNLAKGLSVKTDFRSPDVIASKDMEDAEKLGV